MVFKTNTKMYDWSVCFVFFKFKFVYRKITGCPSFTILFHSHSCSFVVGMWS